MVLRDPIPPWDLHFLKISALPAYLPTNLSSGQTRAHKKRKKNSPRESKKKTTGS